MKNLFFEELTIVSKTEKAALRVQLSPKKNVILGENDVGKSTLIKSLYHVLGADTPKLNNSRWKQANPIYFLRFSVGAKKFSILRDEKYFGLFDESNELISQHSGVSGQTGIGKTINDLLGFNIQLESKDDVLRDAGPAYYFLPFYVDQDVGWTQTWTSFSGLQQFKRYRAKMIEYHLGIRSQKYYDAVRQNKVLVDRSKELSNQKNAIIVVRDNYKKRKQSQQVDIDPASFRSEVEEIVIHYNESSELQKLHLTQIKNARNEKIGIENEIEVLLRSIKELEADYIYSETPSTPDVVDCPTCGSTFDNDVAARFGILDDVDYCRGLIDQKKKNLLEMEPKLQELEETYLQSSKQVDSLETTLQRKREDVTFSDLIASEGYKDIVKSISDDINSIVEDEIEIEATLLETRDDLAIDRDQKKEIVEFYQSKMKEALNSLDVQVLSSDDYKTPIKIIDANALGSDLPRSLLAQYLTFLHTIMKFNRFTVCPFVIDSPLQQEQDDKNSDSIFSFILTGVLESQQLVLGTLNLDAISNSGKLLQGVNIIHLDTKFGLLSQENYEELLVDIEPYHEATLAVS